MGKLNTRTRTYLAMSNYRLPDGAKAQWICQLPETWRDYIAYRVHEYCIDQWIYSGDIPEIIENVMDSTIGDTVMDVLNPYRDQH